MIARSGMRSDADGYLSARPLGDTLRSTDRPLVEQPKGRRCVCGTKLSIYNPDSHCAACEPETWADH